MCMKSTLSFISFGILLLVLLPKVGTSQSQTYHLQVIIPADHALVHELVTAISDLTGSELLCQFKPVLNQMVLLSDSPIDLAAALQYLEDSGHYVADLDGIAFPSQNGEPDDHFSLGAVKLRWLEDHRQGLNIPVHHPVMILTQLESERFPSEQLTELIAEGKAVVIN